MKRICLLILCLCSALISVNAQQKLRIVDAADQSPIAAGTIFDAEGNVIGFTLNNGTLMPIPETAYPITIRCVGYDLLTIPAPENKDWMMTPASYELEEVVVLPPKYAAVRQLFYVREYVSGSTADYERHEFREYMVERYVPASKESKYHGSTDFYCYPGRLYTRVHTSRRDSLSYDPYAESKPLLSAFELYITTGTVRAPKSFTDENAQGPHVYQKMGGILTMKQNDYTFTIVEDYLAKKKDHEWSPWLFKLLGLKVDIHTFYMISTYPVDLDGEYEDKDFTDFSMALEMSIQGKKIEKVTESKEPIRSKAMLEMYLVSNKHLTIDDARAAMKNRPKQMRIEVPARVPRLDEATRQFIKDAVASASAEQ